MFLEARPVKIDKTTTNKNIDLIRVTEERVYFKLKRTKIRMEF